jgi:hypothetical protein
MAYGFASAGKVVPTLDCQLESAERELGTILQWIGAQAIGQNKKTDIRSSSTFEHWYEIS